MITNPYILLFAVHRVPVDGTIFTIAAIIIALLIIGYTFIANKGLNKANEHCESILAILIQMGPRYSKNLLTKFYTKQFPTKKSQWATELEAESFANKIITKSQTIDPNVEIDYLLVVKNKGLSFRCSMVRLMFRLAAEGDGIKNDEWKFILDTMSRLKINKRSYDYFIKYYSPLRTEFDDDSQYYNEEAKKEYAASTPSNIIQQYYDILGISIGASKQEIQKAYHALALIHHPDMQQNAERKEECEAKMAQINDAYEKVIASL